MAKHVKRRIPKLQFTKLRGIGWHVSYRHPVTGMPRRERFGNLPRGEAEKAYHKWVATWLDGERAKAEPKVKGERNAASLASPLKPNVKVTPGSLLHIASGLLHYEESRARRPGEPRRAGTITVAVLNDRKKHVADFLAFVNGRYTEGAVGKMKLADLLMADVEAYNESLVKAKYSATQVNKRLQIVKKLIDRAGRPEYGGQVLGWNWDSRDVVQGLPVKKRELPTREQLQKLLNATDARGRAMIWLGIGLGFGQSDLAVIRVGQIDEKGYDLRRQKTGVERYGGTPKMVWKAMQDFLNETPRPEGELLFVTRKGQAVVHEKGDSVQQWWHKLRKAVGESSKTLGGFYVLRHVGATEFGSRGGCSVSSMKRWLGHAASSDMADVYMRPVAPEYRAVVEWVRKALKSGDDGWKAAKQA